MKKNFLLTMLAAVCLVACAETQTKTEIKVTGELGEPQPTFLYNFSNRRSSLKDKSATVSSPSLLIRLSQLLP